MKKGDYIRTTGTGRTTDWGKCWWGIVSQRKGKSVFVYFDGGFSENQLSIDEVELIPVRLLMAKWKKANKPGRISILMKKFGLSKIEAEEMYNPNPAYFPIEIKRGFYNYFDS